MWFWSLLRSSLSYPVIWHLYGFSCILFLSGQLHEQLSITRPFPNHVGFFLTNSLCINPLAGTCQSHYASRDYFYCNVYMNWHYNFIVFLYYQGENQRDISTDWCLTCCSCQEREPMTHDDPLVKWYETAKNLHHYMKLQTVAIAPLIHK